MTAESTNSSAADPLANPCPLAAAIHEFRDFDPQAKKDLPGYARSRARRLSFCRLHPHTVEPVADTVVHRGRT